MPLYHGDRAPQSITLRQCFAAEVQLSPWDSLLLGRACRLSPTCWLGTRGATVALCPWVGDSRLPGPAQTSPSTETPPPPPCHLLAKHPLRLPKLRAYSHLPGWLQLPGEVPALPAQPDSAQSPGTPLPLLGCGVWHPGGRRLGAPIAFPSGRVVMSRAPSPATNLFLLFIPHGQGMLSAGPRLLACSAGRSASRWCAGRGWYGIKVGVFWGVFPLFVEGGWNPSIIPQGKGWEHLESSGRAVTHPAASLTSYSWLSSPSDKGRASPVGSGRR